MTRVMRAFAALSVAIGLAVPSIGMAQGTGAGDAGWYIGGALGQSKADGFCDIVGPGGSCDDKDTTWRVFGGYQVNKNFALEFGYSQLGEITAQDSTGRIALDATAFEFTVLGILPVADKFSIYGRAGLYMADTELAATVVGLGSVTVSESNTDLTFGFGVRYDFTRNFAVRAEWQRYTDLGGGNVILEGDLDVMSIGVVYRFQ